ncbi:hypothetical protein [Pseudonocardia sp. N23]|uniref:hypothetical protein n=1 Tax=Pseudonocardia sp. N23 TaxID=1987376 RepID=UPI000BFB7958|nr:hypothetical protein [Pseudonocardia sp. N23]GAY13082.1 hypothetical protein TOK_2001 [Pseudonocardia sp. N23]
MTSALDDTMPDGRRRWLDRQHVVAPHSTPEIDAAGTDAGRHLGHVRAVGRRPTDTVLDEPLTAVPVEFTPTPLLRPGGDVSG